MSGAALEAVERALLRLGADPWNAFLHVDAERARERSRHAEGPLAGLVLSVKDNIAWAGAPMTCGSRHLENYVAPYDATVVERLEHAGAVILGKTNMDEFAAGSSGENSAFGATLNPVDITRVPGGSSSGAGASVASGVCESAIGSDTGGSIRGPASFCGVAALKPSYGFVSRYGLSDLAMSLEGPAPAARDVTTLARVMDAIAGADARDARCTGELAASAAPSHELRIGVPEIAFTDVADDVARPVRAMLSKWERHGATLHPVDLPTLHDALAAYYVINYAEFASAMQRFDGTRYGTVAASPEDARATFGDEVKRRILLGTFVTSREERGRWYDAALKVQAAVAADFARAFEACDIIAMPTMPFRAFKLGERIADPRAMYAADVLTVPANLAGVPAGSVPLHVDGLPVGLQLIGPHGSDARVLSAMKRVEELA